VTATNFGRTRTPLPREACDAHCNAASYDLAQRNGVSKILIINKVMASGRVTAIIVKERLGF
jgi:hypothetical protein